MGLSLPSAQSADRSHPRCYKALDGKGQDLKVTPSKVAILPSACSESRALSCHWLKQQPEEAARIKGWRRDAGVPLTPFPAQLTQTSGSLLGIRVKRHREMGWFHASYLHSSSPLPFQTLAELPNSSQAVNICTQQREEQVPGLWRIHAPE